MKNHIRIFALLLIIPIFWSFSSKNNTMVLIKGAKFSTTDPQDGKKIKVEIKNLIVDKNLVTVADYAAFVEATGYKTQAEIFGNSIIFDFKTSKWEIREGANFRFPFGTTAPKALPNHPVTQVSWYDAVAYAKWKGQRLPTDAEWEFIAKNAGKSLDIYPWGNAFYESGQYKANVWQGSFPHYNSADDGFLTTSPVGYFGVDKVGLTDMGGNVWQWCQDSVQPTGCNANDDLSVRKVCRGGSFLCDKNVCHGFKIGNRTNSTAESGMIHIGFRCVKDL